MAPYLPFDCPTRVTDRNGRSVSYATPVYGLLSDLMGWVRLRFGAPPPRSGQGADEEDGKWPPPPRPF
ncbi:hypothetical protein QV13_01305 [Mesorhizobium hungaricum]|jgi:hypothetical protein|uniref:Uncharacterized protein n=1 Tax=Mesorhizobium hungaricum TaxID=1566387 RepID=A0A1C2EDN8_9HYPH|nr:MULTISPECIES: hypothetical protein [Mesorhizobium]MBN9237993.1 hypothetical protein [Mesorhizobium sp.]MDQ0333444.1 hypothetical protein [Mesorhizobium sp. YL-MeA3-2017]OCX24971.1 hypothetical protein QV13_01305 [Mesorhizobium hungaricum]